MNTRKLHLFDNVRKLLKINRTNHIKQQFLNEEKKTKRMNEYTKRVL